MKFKKGDVVNVVNPGSWRFRRWEIQNVTIDGHYRINGFLFEEGDLESAYVNGMDEVFKWLEENA